MKSNRIFITVIFLAVVIGGFYLFTNTRQEECLNDDLSATFKVSRPSRALKQVTVTTKDASGNTNTFKLNDISRNYHPLEVHNCHFYLIREFNYKFGTRQDPGYRSELWKYDYDGNGKNILTFEEVPPEGKTIFYFTRDFRVDPNEKYLALRRGYLGSDDFAIVIKNSVSLKDSSITEYENIESKNPEVLGDIGLQGWSKNSDYFWVDLYNGAQVSGFVRVDVKNKSFEVFKAPTITMGGDKLNPDTGWVTYNPNAHWSGVVEIDEMERKERLAKGMTSDLHLYNLPTGKDILVESISEDPLWWGQPQWASETVLEYIMPDGQIKQYNIETGEYILIPE